jgi:uncharacterized protein
MGARDRLAQHRYASGNTPPMKCAVYKSMRKADTYLFVAKRDDFSRLPDGLCEHLGRLELVMELELDAGRKLARADAGDVMARLQSDGFYLQLPPVSTIFPQVPSYRC